MGRWLSCQMPSVVPNNSRPAARLTFLAASIEHKPAFALAGFARLRYPGFYLLRQLPELVVIQAPQSGDQVFGVVG